MVKLNILQLNSEDSDQISRCAVSDLGLQCLTMSIKKDFRLKWVNAKHLVSCLVFTEPKF